MGNILFPLAMLKTTDSCFFNSVPSSYDALKNFGEHPES